MKNLIVTLTIIISLLIFSIINVIADDDANNIEKDLVISTTTSNDLNQPINYNITKWFEWYKTLPHEIQINVNLLKFINWDIQTQDWFEWNSELELEIQDKLKIPNRYEWNEQTYKWLEWFSSLTSKSQNEINLCEIRTWFDWYNSLPFKLEKLGNKPYIEYFATIQKEVYGVDTIIGMPIKIDYEWFDWFHSLTSEEQKRIYFRPRYFVAIQRDVYAIEYFNKEFYISIGSKDIPLEYYGYPNDNMDQKYIPKSLDKIYEIALYTEDNSIEYTEEPFLITFNLSDADISPDDFNNLYGVLYDGDEIKEYISGTYTQDTKAFKFYIDKPGNYAVNIVKNTMQLKLTIGNTSYTVNDSQKTFDSAPVIVNDRTLVPVRAIAECFGAQVEWDETAKTATIIYNGKISALTIGKLASGMDVPAQIINGRTMVPLRYISENFGANVTYDDRLKSIAIVVIGE